MTADWVMVIITAVYVVATIFICWANIQSAKASKQQLNEMQRQYAELNRPNIEVELIYSKRSFYGLRFVNHGNTTANHVRIDLLSDFVEALPEPRFLELIKKQKEKECIIGVGQHFDLYFGSNHFRQNPPKVPMRGKVIYQGNGQCYESEFEIDIEHYSTFFSVDSEHDDVIRQLKDLNTALSKIIISLKDMSESLKKDDKNV